MALWSSGLHAADWGAVMRVESVTLIRAERHPDARITGVIYPEDRVLADFLENGWYAVFAATEAERDLDRALGYVPAAALAGPYSGFRSRGISADEPDRGQDLLEDRRSFKQLVRSLSSVRSPRIDDLPAMRRRRAVRVLTSYSPTNYFVSNGRAYGFEYSLLKDYEAYLNDGSGYGDLPVHVEFIPLPERELVSALTSGLGDVIAAGLNHASKPPPGTAFTQPYLSGINTVFITHKQAPPIESVADLAGRNVFVRPVGNYYEALGELNARLGEMGMPAVRMVRVKGVSTAEDLMEMVNAGLIDLSVTESHLAELWSSVFGNLVVFDTEPLQRGSSLAWMVRRENPLLLQSLNTFIEANKRGTLSGNIYFNRYFKNSRRLRNPLDPNDRNRFSRYAPLFKRYGKVFGIDWMLLAAMAYEESGMDPSAVSPRGAIGLMQVLPSTAAMVGVDPGRLALPEDNIRAASAYLARLRDLYFDLEGMSQAARMRFTLAAYNAGPERVLLARDLTAEIGYDPDLWFGNGEVGVLRLVGSEPVRYVSNINKYYLAYSLTDNIKDYKKRNLSNALYWP